MTLMDYDGDLMHTVEIARDFYGRSVIFDQKAAAFYPSPKITLAFVVRLTGPW